MTRRLVGQFARFGMVGIAGLLVDLGVLFVTAPWLGWYGGRAISFWAAASATWWLNRRFTFAPATAESTVVTKGAVGGEYLRYLGSMMVGAALNYGAYVLVLHFVQGPKAPALGVVVGSLAGMFANFIAARQFVFRQTPLRNGAMQDLSLWPVVDAARLTGVFTDIDDTLTTDGAITPDALQALADLKTAGLQVVAITGRPSGWSEGFALRWPVDAIVAENGAVALIRQPDGSLDRRYQQNAATRSVNFARMQQVLARIEAEIPGARRATDSAGRECDIAIDHSEFVHLSEAQIAAVVAVMRDEGMHATVSSIHINGWYGEHNKLEGARWIVRELWGRDLDAERDRWAYVGDSTNDQLMFEAFANSVGVANIARFVPMLTHLPRYVTQGERGAGFAEVARAVLAAR